MKKNKIFKIRYLIFIAIIFILAAFFIVIKNYQVPEIVIDQQLSTGNLQSAPAAVDPLIDGQQKTQSGTINPINNALSRITKKPFGIFVTPKNSPVQPERFQGYHTAVDLETTPEEQNIDVQVKVFCDGKLLMAKTASGYGGVAAASCNLNGKDVTIIYGHIRLSSVHAKVGDQLKAGDFLANLGTGNSQETDGERKHLHLGIHIGSAIYILGYVKAKNELSQWIDPATYLN